jgi:ornithine cyclodeaminase
VKLRLLSAQELQGLVTMSAASEAMKRAFRELSLGRASAPPRTHVDVPAQAGKTLLMGAHLPGVGLASKIVSYFPSNRSRGLPAIHGIVIVLDETSGAPVALLDGTELTAFRTGAGTSASIDLLSRRDARRGALFGCGGQAAMQLLAMDDARRFELVRVFAPRPERVAAFIEAMQPEVRARLEPARSPTEAVRDADVVVAATSSSTPVFDGRELPPGCHVTAIGSITPAMREVDETTIARSRRFVDSVPGVLEEAGELISAIASGTVEAKVLVEIGAVVADAELGRRSESELTFYKSVGHAVQDVAIARLLLERANELGRGKEIEL